MDMKITFLGTASAKPTEKRNHTSILLSYCAENILIDCGEGTQRQFRKANLNPCKLTKILITHWHGDHTLGLPGLLETMAMSEYSHTLEIYGPKGTKENISHFEKIYGKFKIKLEVHEITSSSTFIDNKDFQIQASTMKHGIPTLAYAFILKDKLRLHKTKLAKLKLPNSPLLKDLQEGKDITHPKTKKKIKASSLTYKQEGKKIAFILDTAPNENTIKIAKDADLLICEASFSVEGSTKANAYKHLTTEDAGKIAKKAKVKKLIITHPSGKYSHRPSFLLKETKKVFKATTIADDLEAVTI